MPLTLYHNPRCSKSRQTLELLIQKKVEVDVVEYLKTPPTVATIKRILGLLDMHARDLMRKGQTEYKDMGLDDETLSDAQLVDAMHQHPILIERPILVSEKAARIGRPPEAVLAVLDK